MRFGVFDMPLGEVPWKSKGNLNRIGDKFRERAQIGLQDLVAFNLWRASHFHVMNGFQAMFRARTRNKHITVAQRHKRRTTIIDKLSREPGMNLARMDDIAGIRLIFDDIDELYEFRKNFLSSKHKHTRKSETDKYDYIKNPKHTGYRGIHDIYSYHSNSQNSSVANGLMIEVQYRTKYQHAWATANEIITMTTDHRTKFAAGDERYLEFFRLASEIFARAYEGARSLYKEKNNGAILDEIQKIDSDINVLRFLESLDTAYQNIDFNNSAILQFKNDNLIIIPIPRFRNAQEIYFKYELDNPNDDIVLVLSQTFDQIRSAYRNYFSDSGEFIRFLKEGIVTLK